MIVHTNTVQNTNIFVFKGFSNFFLLKGMHSGDFLRVLAKTQCVQNTKTQFENTKTQFENAKTQFENAKTQFENAKTQFENAKTQFLN